MNSSIYYWYTFRWYNIYYKIYECYLFTTVGLTYSICIIWCRIPSTKSQTCLYWVPWQPNIYNRTSLSRTRLFRITAYLEVTTGNKIMWKRGEIAPQEQFLLFSTLFYIYISNFRSQITYSFVKCGCSIYCFPHSLNSDMSKYGYLEVFQWVPWNSR